MPFLERYKDVTVRRADRAGVVIRSIDAAVGQSQIVDDLTQLIGRNDLSNHLLDLVYGSGRFLNARAGLHAHVHVKTARVHRGKEILPEEREKGDTRRSRIRSPAERLFSRCLNRD